MPGLLRGMARTAVVGGTATPVSNSVSRPQAHPGAAPAQQAYAAEPQQYAPSPPPAGNGGSDPIEQLKELAALKEQGILTDEEFAQQKARILGG